MDLGWHEAIQPKQRKEPLPTVEPSKPDEEALALEARVSAIDETAGTPLTILRNTAYPSSPPYRRISGVSASSDKPKRGWKRQRRSWAKEQRKRSARRASLMIRVRRRIGTGNASGSRGSYGSGSLRGGGDGRCVFDHDAPSLAVVDYDLDYRTLGWFYVLLHPFECTSLVLLDKSN